ncbi:pentatricopeptide repeat (PPR) superfamily protein [Artemisia annua]|uniref:Pentatricopeptide repeat (PPR) superfamily protein n=1 Tax=Artemisia annua TaxID=35608 RepID=A0A2U1KE01_ARTAN|nr:pentatricopeptide repeat (PPR) superfamily protein [Artemisia annua]
MGVFPNLECFNILVKMLCIKGEFDRVMEVIGTMWCKRVYPDVVTYGTLINGLGRACKVLDEMCERGVNPDVMCYNILIDGWFQKGEVGKAGEVWELEELGD